MRDDFGIGFRLEGVAFGLKQLLERQEVFDDAVVDDDDVAGAIAVRVGVLFSGASVSGPAGVADAVVAVDRVEAEDVFEVAEFAGSAADAECVVVAIDGETGGIVAAVFEAFQAVNNDGDGALGAYVSDDAAHQLIISMR